MVCSLVARTQQRRKVERVFVVLAGNYNPEEREEGGMLLEARGASALPAIGTLLQSTPHLKKI